MRTKTSFVSSGVFLFKWRLVSNRLQLHARGHLSVAVCDAVLSLFIHFSCFLYFYLRLVGH